MAAKCPYCGSTNPDNAQYCWNDGRGLTPQKSPPSIDLTKLHWNSQVEFVDVTPKSGQVTQKLTIQNNGPGALEASLSVDDPTLITITPAYINENVSQVEVSLDTSDLGWGQEYDASLRLDILPDNQDIDIPIKIRTQENERIVEEFEKLVKIAEGIALIIGFIASWLVSGRVATEILVVLFVSPTLAVMLTATETLPWDKGYEIAWTNVFGGFLLTAVVSIALAIIESIDEYTADALGTIFLLSSLMLVVANISARLLQKRISETMTQKGVNLQTRAYALLMISVSPCIISMVLIIV